MASREYGQFCGLARAMEMVGERWTMLIIRNLLTGAQRFTDLRKGLPAIPTNILSAASNSSKRQDWPPVARCRIPSAQSSTSSPTTGVISNQR